MKVPPSAPQRALSLERDLSRATPSEAKAEHGGCDEDGDDEGAAANGRQRPERQYSIYKEDPSERGPKESNDDHITKYVQEQLQRLKTNESNEFSEEIAATNDGSNEKRDA